MHSVKLIWITPDAERLLVYIARVSSSNQNNQDYKPLIKYLIKNCHWSPFEMVNMCVEITTTRAVSQQLIRHRSFSFQELSQRYKKVEEYDIPDIRYQCISNRQSSTIQHDKTLIYQEKIIKLYKCINDLYDDMIKDDVAKECARFILPLSTKTKIYMNGTLRSWIHYLNIRLDEHTQKEHRELAIEILKIFKDNFPLIYECLYENII